PPGLVGLAFGQRLVERRLRILHGADIGLLRHSLTRAGELDRLQRDAVRLRGGLRIDPGAVLLVDEERFGAWRRAPGFAAGDRFQECLAAELRGEIEAT